MACFSRASSRGQPNQPYLGDTVCFLYRFFVARFGAVLWRYFGGYLPQFRSTCNSCSSGSDAVRRLAEYKLQNTIANGQTQTEHPSRITVPIFFCVARALFATRAHPKSSPSTPPIRPASSNAHLFDQARQMIWQPSRMGFSFSQ